MHIWPQFIRLPIILAACSSVYRWGYPTIYISYYLYDQALLLSTDPIDRQREGYISIWDDLEPA